MISMSIDAVSVPRFRDALERTPTLKTRVFTAQELDSLATRKDLYKVWQPDLQFAKQQ